MKILTVISLVAALLNPISTKPSKLDRVINATPINGFNAQLSYSYSTGEALFSEGIEFYATAEYNFPSEFYIDINVHLDAPVERATLRLWLTTPQSGSNYTLNFIAVNCRITSLNEVRNLISFEMTNAQDCTIKLVYNCDMVKSMYGYDPFIDIVDDKFLNSWVSTGQTICNITNFSLDSVTPMTETDYTSYIDNIESYIDGLEGVLGNSYTELQDISDYLANISTNSTLINTTLTNIDTNIASVNSRLSTISSNLSRANYIAEYVANVQTTNDFGIKKLPNDLVIKNTYRENQGRGYYAPVYYSSNTIAQMQKAYIVIHLKDIHTSYEWYYMPVPYFYDVTQHITTYPELVRNLTFIDMQTKYIYQLRIAFKCEYDDDSGFNLTSVKLNMYRVSATSASTALSAVTTASYIDFLYYAEGTFEPNLDMTNTNNMIDQLLDYWNKSGSDIGINQSNEQTVSGFWGQAKQIVDQSLPNLPIPNANEFFQSGGVFQMVTKPIGDLIGINGIYRYGIVVILLTILVKVIV